MMLPELKIKITADPTAAKAGMKEITKAQDALEAATVKHNSTRAKLDAALKSGLVTQKAHSASIKESEEMYEAAARKAAAYAGATASISRQAKVATGVMQNNASQIANVGAQFNDIGVMMAAGQNPFMLAIQQGSQLNQVMAQMGGGQKALQGIAQGFMTMINPMSLATIGLIAGGAALVQWGVSALGASDEAKELAENMGLVEERMTSLNSELRQAGLGATSEELTLLDAIAAKMDDIARIREIEATAVGHNLRAARSRLENEEAELDVLQEQLVTLQSLQTRKDRLVPSTSALVEQERILGEQMLVNVDTMLEHEAAAQLLRDGISASVVQALMLSEVDIAAGLDPAVRAAAELASNLQISLAAAQAMQGAGGRGGAGPGGPMGAAELFEASSGGINYGDFGASDSAAKRGGGGGGGGGASGRGDISALVESLQTEQETVDAWRETALESLQDANAAELEIIGGHAEAKARIEQEYTDRVMAMNDAASKHEIDMRKKTVSSVIGLLENMGEKNKGIAKAAVALNAARAIGETIQNTAAASVRALAELGPIAGPPAAARIKAYGAVQAGIIGANAVLSMGKGGGGGGGSADVGGSGSSGGAAQAPTTTLNISLQNDPMGFGESFARQLVAQLNGAQRNGGSLQASIS